MDPSCPARGGRRGDPWAWGVVAASPAGHLSLGVPSPLVVAGDPCLSPVPLEDLVGLVGLGQEEVGVPSGLVGPCDQVVGLAQGAACGQGEAPFPSGVVAPLVPAVAPCCGDASCQVEGEGAATLAAVASGRHRRGHLAALLFLGRRRHGHAARHLVGPHCRSSGDALLPTTASLQLQ